MRSYRRIVFVLFLSLILIAGCGSEVEPTPTSESLLAQPEIPPVPALDATKVAEGKVVYEANCAACHGAEGEGQPNWRERKADGSLPAPPHDSTGHTWHHADEVLIGIMADGQPTFPQSQMPKYRDVLTFEEMEATLEYMKSWWGPDERQFQWRVTWQTQQYSQ